MSLLAFALSSFRNQSVCIDETMGVVSYILFLAFVISLILVAATYDGVTDFWLFYATSSILFGSGLLVDWIFSGYNSFVYDPDPINWRRKTDPQY